MGGQYGAGLYIKDQNIPAFNLAEVSNGKIIPAPIFEHFKTGSEID